MHPLNMLSTYTRRTLLQCSKSVVRFSQLPTMHATIADQPVFKRRPSKKLKRVLVLMIKLLKIFIWTTKQVFGYSGLKRKNIQLKPPTFEIVIWWIKYCIYCIRQTWLNHNILLIKVALNNMRQFTFHRKRCDTVFDPD